MKYTTILDSLLEGTPLGSTGVSAMADLLLDPAGEVPVKADLLRALSRKGETQEEIAGFVRAFLEHAVRPPLDLAGLDRPAVDVCGTGGDQLQLFNVSTTSMFLLAAAGVAVVKHGNRGITSKSGGADVLEALGIRIDLPPDRFAECVRRNGAAFMLAPQYHPAFAAVAPVRRLLAAEGTRTLFNIIGPLLNPLQPAFQLAGVFDAALPDIYAAILRDLGRTCAWAVHGRTADGRGMDEISTLGPTTIVCATPAGLTRQTITLASPPAVLVDLQGQDAGWNARLLVALLDGSDRSPRRDLMIANAAGALQVTGTARTWEEGTALAVEALESGKSLKVLRALQEFS